MPVVISNKTTTSNSKDRSFPRLVTNSMLFSFEDGDANSSSIRRNMQRPRMDIDQERFGKVLRAVPVMIW